MSEGITLPDILAYTLAEAIHDIESRGFIPQIQRTASPRGVGVGQERIVRVRELKEKGVLELTVAAEDWGY